MGSVQRSLKISFGIFLFAFPFSLRFLFYEEAAYRFGNFNPWVSEFVYVPEVLLLIIFALWAFLQHKGGWRRARPDPVLCVLFALFLLNALVVGLWRGDAVLGLMFVWRMLEGAMLYTLVADRLLPPRKMVSLLLMGAAFQVALGFWQYRLNGSVGLSLLGEPAIGADVLNVAKTDLADGAKQIRAYGTFLHPNILAAYLIAVLLMALDYLSARQKILWLLLIGGGVYLTQSLAAAAVGSAALGLWGLFCLLRTPAARRGIVLLILMALLIGNAWFFYSSHRVQAAAPAFTERLEQNVISRAMLAAHPLGVGPRQFTLAMENHSGRPLKPWEFQPAHNAYFLAANETGLQGLLILLTALFLLIARLSKNGNAIPLLGLLLLAPMDHFLWDSFAGLMLAVLALGFFSLHNQSAETL